MWIGTSFNSCLTWLWAWKENVVVVIIINLYFSVILMLRVWACCAMSCMDRTKRYFCVHVIYGDVPSMDQANQTSYGCIYWPAVAYPRRVCSKPVVPFWPSWKSCSCKKFSYMKFCHTCPKLLKIWSSQKEGWIELKVPEPEFIMRMHLQPLKLHNKFGLLFWLMWKFLRNMLRSFQT